MVRLFSCLVILLGILLTGCGSDVVQQAVNPPAQAELPEAPANKGLSPEETEALVSSWKQFVDRFKERVPAAKEKAMKRENTTKFSVNWIEIDLKKSDSVISPVVGYVKLRTNVEMYYEFTKRTSYFEDEYVLEFEPDGSRWKYKTGTHQRLDTGYADKEPKPLPDLIGYVKIIFEE